MGSGVVDTEGAVVVVVLVATVTGLAINLWMQFWGRCTPSVFSISGASSWQFSCGDSETGGIRGSLPALAGDKDTHSPDGGR